MNVQLVPVALLASSLRSSVDPKNVDLGNLLLAGSLIATATSRGDV